MGNATSSALRADDPAIPASATGADGPAFGSLAAIGAPRKLKKKPVLVLDPEELEKAHMMFQEASAELLGENVERPERPAPLLGLAPMDDDDGDPLDGGDIDAIDDVEIPSAEDVLRMTKSRPAMDEADEAAIAAQLEGLDLDSRIFPSLPLRSEEEIAAQDEADRLAAEALGMPDEDKPQPVEMPDLTASEACEDVAEDETETLADEKLPVPEAAADAVSRTFEANAAPLGDAHDYPRNCGKEDLAEDRAENLHSLGDLPVNPLPEPEPEPAMELTQDVEPVIPDLATSETDGVEEHGETPVHGAVAEPAHKPAFGEEPFLDFPTVPVSWSDPAEQLIASPDPLPEPAPQEDLVVDSWRQEGPAFPQQPIEFQTAETAADEPREDRFEWSYEDEAALQPEPTQEYDAEEQAEPEQEQEEHGQYTEVDDEPVDGYAFMYANNPRARTIHALAEGESNSLRAKLLKERQDEQRALEAEANQPSIFGRFAVWLKGLFS